jgi:transcription elongation GreA/GreB family factor
MEENLSYITSRAAEAKLFRTEKRAKWFFEDYIGEVESLFREAEIIDDAVAKSDARLNCLPFIVLDSSFTLIDSKKRVKFCHMAYDPLLECKDNENNVYFLSAAGRALLLKRPGEDLRADLGNGLADYTVNSIKIN